MPNRTNTHGDYSESSELWGAMIELVNKSPNAIKFSPVQGRSLTFIIEKITRICYGDNDFNDHWLDISGYAQLAAGNPADSKETSKPEVQQCH